MTRLIATFFYVGYLRPAPGTWGSLAALPVGWLLYSVGGLWAILIGIISAFGLGWWATIAETKGQEDHDPSEIVIDEVAGQWIALLPVFYGASMMGVSVTALWPGWIASFVLFRLFDITKPWIIGHADRRGDALGVMLDDIYAGIFAAIGTIAVAALAHGVLMG